MRAEEVEALRSTWVEIQAREPVTTYNVDIDRYLDVLESGRGGCKPYVVLVSREGKPVTMLVARAGPRRVIVRMGLKTVSLGSLPVLAVIYGGLLGYVTYETAQLLWERLWDDLGAREFEAIWFNSVPTESLACGFFQQAAPWLCRDRFARLEPHWRMTVPDGMEAFYGSLSGKRRYNLKRTVRLFDEALGSRSVVTAYRAEADVPMLAAQAEGIVSRTYQRGMGSGFRDSPEMRLLLTRAAGRGWLRGHVLTVDGERCAFQMGLVYGGTYFLEYISYLPWFKEHSPGTVLFLKVLETLCANPRIHALDFGYGDQQYKQAYGEECWEEASFYVFAPRLRPLLLNGVRTCALAVERALKGLARRFALDRWVKRRWRERLEAADAR